MVGLVGVEIVIGDDVLIGPKVLLCAADNEFASTDISIRIHGHRACRIVIGNDVLIAANAVVVSGVSIGNGCIVGAGSVVTNDLASMTPCGGNRARPIRSSLTQAA